MIDTEKIPLTEADTAAYDSTAQILKAAMAYVNPSIGRMMAVMAKSIELRHMMQYLDQGGVSACGVNNRAIPPEEVIRDLRKYCGAKEKEQLDRCLNIGTLFQSPLPDHVPCHPHGIEPDSLKRSSPSSLS